MNAVNCFKRLKRMDFFIKRKATGTPSHFAKLLEISETTLYRNIIDLKNLGAVIVYDKEKESYIYEEPFELIV